LQSLYFPPYHNKYNPIERCWGILELHWNGTLLSSVDVMTEWAKTMLWKGIHLIVEISTKVYEKGVILSKSVMRAIEKRLKRNPELPKWDILIEPMVAA
jgi:Rhodopirellula transposase DDE domain